MESRSPLSTEDQLTATDAIAAVDYISSLLIKTEFDLDQLLQEAARTTAEQMDRKASAIRLLDPDTDELVVRAVFGLSEWFIDEGPRYGLQSRYQRMIANGGILEVEDVDDDPDLLFTEAAQKEGIRSLLAVGLYSQGELIGALSVYSSVRRDFSSIEVDSFRLIANQISVAIELARLHEVRSEKERLDRDLAIASEIQRRALPEEPPEIPGYSIACRYVPFEQVGGDFYDFIELPLGNTGIMVGDVSGKGVQAALLSLATRTVISTHAEYEYSIGEIIARSNKTLYRDTEPEQFATLAYGVLNATNDRLTYVTALIPEPVLVRDGKITLLDTEGLPVGILEDAAYPFDVLDLQPGDLLVMYTDGYSEIFDKDGNMFGDERVRQCILDHQDLEPEALIDALDAEVDRFLEGSEHGDDRTLVVMRKE